MTTAQVADRANATTQSPRLRVEVASDLLGREDAWPGAFRSVTRIAPPLWVIPYWSWARLGALGVGATPTVLVNGWQFRGAVPATAIIDLITKLERGNNKAAAPGN